MKVIISTSLKDNFNNYVVVDTFKKVDELKGVTTIIIHSYSEQDFEVGVFITNLVKKGISQFIYINKKPNNIVLMALRGIENSRYYEDEFYFDDEEELNVLLADIEEEQETVSTALATPALGIIQNFVESYQRGDEKIKAPIYLEQVLDATNELVAITHQQELQLATMGASAIEVFNKASAVIKSIQQQRNTLEEKLTELELSQANAISSKPTFGNNVMFFSPYKYLGNAKILLIREYSPCRYLTSFVLGYLNHLHYELNRRPKLIFVHQKGQGVALKYSSYPAITQESMNMASLYDGEIIATNNPKKEVMKDLLSKPNDVIIVVDRLYGNSDIVTGRVTKINAVGSRSDVARYHIKPEETIFSVTAQPKQLFCIPTIKQFPQEIDARQSYYSQLFAANYTNLDNRLGL